MFFELLGPYYRSYDSSKGAAQLPLLVLVVPRGGLREEVGIVGTNEHSRNKPSTSLGFFRAQLDNFVDFILPYDTSFTHPHFPAREILLVHQPKLSLHEISHS